MKTYETTQDRADLRNHDEEPLAWSDEFLLGHAPMDSVHEEFVDVIGRLQRASDDAFPELFDELAEHLSHHFELENRWMMETDFPPRECHIDEHAAVMASVSEVRKVAAAGDTDECRKFVNALVRWFPSHADHLDSALAHWLTKRSYGGKPIVVRRGLKLR